MLSISQRFSQILLSARPTGAARLAAPSLPGAGAALTALALAEAAPGRLALAITAGAAELERVHGDLLTLAHDDTARPLAFPAAAEGDAEATATRLQAAAEIAAGDAAMSIVVVTSLRALLQPVPDPRAVRSASTHLAAGTRHSFDTLVERLANYGYERQSDVAAPGSMAVRGGLLDIWPPGAAAPWRLEFFGDELESLRTFDPATQLSTGHGAELWLPPCDESALTTIMPLDLMPEQAAFVWLEHDRLRAALLLPGEGALPVRQGEQLEELALRRNPWLQLFSGDPAPSGMAALPLDIAPLPGLAELGAGELRHPELLMGARQKLLQDFNRRAGTGETVYLSMDTPGTCELIARELGEGSLVHVTRGMLSGGFSMPGLLVATQPDLYAARSLVRRRSQAQVTRGGRIKDADDLSPGDLVVHVDHGIGRFMGSTEIEIGGQRTEVFTIEYAEGARLHVPVSHAHLLSRYVGVAGRRAKLHRLGGRRWTREKSEAERAVADLAAALLDTQARRRVVKGLSFDVEPPWLVEFEATFPYQETEDQERIIAEVKSDMASEQPMDRLICGDAGYGKTEIAMRAAFIAVMNGRQVAVLVPTTILAEQHYETFCERMAAFPVKIAALSRFHSPARRAAILADARGGRVDIVIGTHALLGRDVAFENLGLLVIDEEQRFGVKHKERLKQVRQVVDVLTLSATPIPRTLYMSMTGARDMSLLQTPPRERVAVETKVARDTDNTIRNAILRELNRNGQIYFLYNRVMTIEMMRVRLEKIVPEARVAIAHGQMADNELARVMREFESGALDVLLCTTIVESGLDIPRANTILVHRADRFGIADLYQLRGRVGRSARRGFAWLLLPEYGHIDEDARQRIAALQKHSGLGAGFNLALRDLEIRGAGNLLGAAQSGHIAAVGFGLYCQLLRRTIARMKGERVPLLVSVDLDLDFLELSPGTVDLDNAACLPYAYVEEEAHRMALHRRLAEAVSVKEIKALRGELSDRYGRPPAAALRLLRIAELRVCAAEKGIGRIETRARKVYLFKAGERMPLLVAGRLPLLSGKTSDQRLGSLLKVVTTLSV